MSAAAGAEGGQPAGGPVQRNLVVVAGEGSTSQRLEGAGVPDAEQAASGVCVLIEAGELRAVMGEGKGR